MRLNGASMGEERANERESEVGERVEARRKSEEGSIEGRKERRKEEAFKPRKAFLSLTRQAAALRSAGSHLKVNICNSDDVATVLSSLQTLDTSDRIQFCVNVVIP